jgi:AmmeMemoRadiSam system protein B
MSEAAVPDHIRTPHLRPIQPLPMQKDGQQFVALRDPTMLSQRTMVVPPQAMAALQRFQGQLTLDQLAEQLRAPVEQLTQLATALDQLGLLWGPTFEQMEKQRWTAIKEAGAFPPTASASLGEDEAACRKTLDEYFDQAEDPEFEETLKGIIAPHLDYERGWPNYAQAYYPLRDMMEKPDRVVVLGTNHFGLGDGVVFTELGFDTPLGRCRPDEEVVSKVVGALGRPVIVDQLDHLPEHSVELQIPWIQHCLGDVPVVAALMPDPLGQMLDDPEAPRVDGSTFISTLRQALDEVGGNTFYIGGCDLSHVGPQFGEPAAVDDQRRMDVETIDRDMIAKYLTGDSDEFLSAFKWNKNPTRWCSIGAMNGLLELAQPESVELIDYRQAVDEQGMAMVTCASIALI